MESTVFFLNIYLCCLMYSEGVIPYSSLKQARKYPKSLKPLAYAASDMLLPSSISSLKLFLSLIFRINSLPDMSVSPFIFR